MTTEEKKSKLSPEDANYEVVITRLGVDTNGKTVSIPATKLRKGIKKAVEDLVSMVTDEEGIDTGDWEIAGIKALKRKTEFEKGKAVAGQVTKAMEGIKTE